MGFASVWGIESILKTVDFPGWGEGMNGLRVEGVMGNILVSKRK